jgi:hypothetical protein
MMQKPFLILLTLRFKNLYLIYSNFQVNEPHYFYLTHTAKGGTRRVGAKAQRKK